MMFSPITNKKVDAGEKVDWLVKEADRGQLRTVFKLDI